MSAHDIIWTQPPAMVPGASRLLPMPHSAFQAPAILRFDTDDFMPAFMNLLATSPEQLVDYKVRRETWRGFVELEQPARARVPSRVRQRLGLPSLRNEPLQGRTTERLGGRTTATLERAIDTTAPDVPLKLYQPAHMRHYLVACSLVCRTTGLPDREVDRGKGEETGWVMRRLLPPLARPEAPVSEWEEHAWVPVGPQRYVWQRVTNRAEPLDGEERLPFFAMTYAENDKRKRRVFAGVVPVGKRELYLGAAKSAGSSSGGVTVRTARKVLFRKEVLEPWKSLVRASEDVRLSFLPDLARGSRAATDAERRDRLRVERARLQAASWLILLDLARFLSTYLKPVWRAVQQPSLRGDLDPPGQKLFDALDRATLSEALSERLRHADELTDGGRELYPSSSVVSTLREALALYADGDGIDATLQSTLESVDELYVRDKDDRLALFPSFLFPLADPDLPSEVAIPPVDPLGPLSDEETKDGLLDADSDDTAVSVLEGLDAFAVLVLRALQDDDAQPAPQPAVPTAAIQPADALEGWFRIRCVYERPACEPLHPPIVSEPTEPFQLAGFFDPDAPARPIRIGLPIDTTPAGLRKFDKNTAFVISDTLCGQIQRFKGLTLGDLVLSVLPWPFHKDLPNLSEGGPCKKGEMSLGMVCSLSIPIVTICALILLMIIISLLDFVFRWLPYFIICFPIPGLKAKKPPTPATP